MSEFEDAKKDPTKLLTIVEKLTKENERLKAENAEAAQLISGFNKERDASDMAERQQHIHTISQDSKGYLRADLLANLCLPDLRLIRNTFKIENARDYLEYFERRQKEEIAGKRRTGLTVGEYDSKTKKYKDGI